MNISIIKEEREFKNLEICWNNFASKSSNIFLTFDWQFAWWRSFGKGKKSLFIVVAYEGLEVKGIAPLMLIKRFGFRELRFIGHGISDYEDFIIYNDNANKEEVIAGILEKISESMDWDILRIFKITSDSQNISLIREIEGKKNRLAVFLEQHQDGAPYITIESSWGEYHVSLRKEFIADTRRQINRIKGLNQPFIIENIRKEDEVRIYLERLSCFHKAKHKGRDGSSIFNDKTSYDFLLAVSKKFLKKGWLNLSYIQIGNIVAGAHLGFTFKGVFYYYLPGYNPDFYKYSIGRVLLFDLLHQCFNKGYKKFDFTIGEETYKKEWNVNINRLYFLTIYQKTLRGYTAYLVFNRFNILLKKIIGKKC
jgi:CelD/BcsL family acetyltransferase involved in cellulose biosynthesis